MLMRRNVQRNNVYSHKWSNNRNELYDVALIHLIDEPLVPSDRIEPARLLKPAMNFKDVAGMKCVQDGE